MKTNYTPGPWTTDCEICEVTGSISIVANGPIVYVKDNSNGPDNQKANAKLIAAAPELLDACRSGLAAMLCLQARAENKGEKIIAEECRVQVASIRYAIAKAS